MEIRNVSKDLWGIFKHYHYLTATIPSNGQCYVGFINYEPVAIVVMSKFPHPGNPDIVKVSRIVVLPHWQSYSIGAKMLKAIIEKDYMDYDVRLTSALPLMFYAYSKNPDWVITTQMIFTKLSPTNSLNNRLNVYMETYKFINYNVEKQLSIIENPQYVVPEEARSKYPKKSNKDKMERVYFMIEEAKRLNINIDNVHEERTKEKPKMSLDDLF